MSILECKRMVGLSLSGTSISKGPDLSEADQLSTGRSAAGRSFICSCTCKSLYFIYLIQPKPTSPRPLPVCGCACVDADVPQSPTLTQSFTSARYQLLPGGCQASSESMGLFSQFSKCESGTGSERPECFHRWAQTLGDWQSGR